MPDWWTYTLSDLQSFSLQTYYRLFELYNAAIWPLQIVALGSGLHLPHWGSGLHLPHWMPHWRSVLHPPRGRLLAAILAGWWLWIAIAFHAARYTTLSWVAVYFAWGFGVEAALLTWAGVIRGRLVLAPPVDAIGRAGRWILLFALLVQPLIGLLLGREWRQTEIFGVAPDPTAVATLGILLLATGRVRWELIAVPVLWCAISGAMLAAMGAPDAWITPVAALIAVSLAAWKTLARRRGRSQRRAI